MKISRAYYYLNGHEVVGTDDVSEWAVQFEKDDVRRVAEFIIDGIRVSTVFIGLDHQYGDGPPLIFETMVFGGGLDQEQDRYSTWDEAEQGHKDMVTRVLEAINKEKKP